MVGLDARRTVTDQGSSTILTAAIVGVLMWLGVATVGVAGVMVAKVQTQAAADAAALAAASPAGGCRTAARLMASNGARMTACRLRGATAQVAAERVVHVPVFGSISIRASASAEASEELRQGE